MRSPLPLIRLLSMVAAVSALATACSATETVTILPEAVAAATTTAQVGALADPAPAEPSTSTSAATGTRDDSCTYLGPDLFDDMQIELAFTAELDSQLDTSVLYRVFDNTGAELVNSATFLEDVRPGERVRIEIDTIEDVPLGSAADGITCTFDGLEAFDTGLQPFRPTTGDVCRFVEVDTFDDIQLELEFTNPLDTTTDIAVDYVLRGPDGVRFEDGVAFIEGAPGERVVHPVDTYAEFPEWVNESTFSCEITSIQDF